MTTYNFDGNEYKANDGAYLSNRVFAGWWGDAKSGEGYTAEYYMPAINADGEGCKLVFTFAVTKDDEPDDDCLSWDDDHIVNVK